MPPDRSGLGALTPREREVAGLVARGYTNAHIARELVLSPGTAANHVENARRKLGVSSRAELAVWASQHGLVAGQDRLLTTVERLLEIEPNDLGSSLDQAAQALAEVLGADKVDAFLHEPTSSTLVARGTSNTPMGRKQRALGLDRLPIANGGRIVEVFVTGTPRLSRRVTADLDELRGIREGLGIRSQILVPLAVAGERQGVLLASSATPELFTERDLRFLGTVARWVGMVAHRAELAQRAAAQAAEQGRRLAADELITVLVHDLRNHLAPLTGRVDLVRRRAEREGHERYAHDAQELGRAVDRLGRLIGELVDTARLDQGLFTLDLQPVDLVALVRETTAALAPADRRVELRAGDDEIPIWADPARVRQAVENLVANAFTYQPDHLPVMVDVGRQDGPDGPRALVAISDHGPGIALDVAPRLFERFAAGPNSVGLGLGLYLARRIAEAHGGTLTVASQLGQGACFTLSLPTEPLPAGHLARNTA